MISWLLRQLELNPRASFSARELNEVDAPAFVNARSSQLVRRLPTLEPGRSFLDPHGRRLTLFEWPDGTLEGIDEESCDGATYPITDADRERWQVDLDEIVAMLRAINELEGEPRRLDDRLVLLGTCVYDAPTVLALLPDPHSAELLFAALPTLLGSNYAAALVLCPTYRPSPQFARVLDGLRLHCDRVGTTHPLGIPLSAIEGIRRLALREFGPVGHEHVLRIGDSFRSVWLQGQDYSLTPQQAVVIELLYLAWRKGTPDVTQETLLRRLGTPDGELYNTFKRSAAWGALIVPGGTKGTYRLNLPLSGE